MVGRADKAVAERPDPGSGGPDGRYCPLDMERPATTPDRLLDAAARLFAERGVDNVSIAEIVRAAGQRNTSAVHYHFGSRDEILRAVLARHVPAIAERRRELLERGAGPARLRRPVGGRGHRPARHRVRPAADGASGPTSRSAPS